MRKQVHLDGREILSKEMLHDRLQESLSLPDYYGRNLDALFDLLTETGEELTLSISYVEQLEKNLGIYAWFLQRALKRADKENPHFSLRLYPEEMTE